MGWGLAARRVPAGPSSRAPPSASRTSLQLCFSRVHSLISKPNLLRRSRWETHTSDRIPSKTRSTRTSSSSTFYRSSKAVGAGSHGPCTLLVMKNGPTRNPGPRGPQRSGGTDVRNVCVPFPATLSLFASDSSISIKCFGDRN